MIGMEYEIQFVDPFMLLSHQNSSHLQNQAKAMEQRSQVGKITT